MKSLEVILAVLLLGCGGGAGSDGAAEVATTESSPRSAVEATAETPAGPEEPAAAESADLPLRTITAAGVPDPCELLTAEDAAELLEAAVGPPRQPDAGGYPCVYWSESGGGQIVLDMSLARGAEVEDTQFAMSLDYCEGAAVAEVDDLGYRAELFRMGKEDCGSDALWVSTGVYFEATELPPNSDWMPKGYIHFTFSLRPDVDDDTLVEKLGAAAERALAKLPR